MPRGTYSELLAVRTHREIGRSLGISRQAVAQAERRALKKLRTQLPNALRLLREIAAAKEVGAATGQACRPVKAALAAQQNIFNRDGSDE